MLKIVIGNKKYSSWSLRGWLALELTGAPYEEIIVALDMPDTAANIARYSPSGRVPLLIDGELHIWDSLAIGEYLNEKFPNAGLWPADSAQRARARSIAAEMHSGFADLRNDCSMKILEEKPRAQLRPETQKDINRIVSIWEDALNAGGGPFLFGAKPCLADAFYAPVVSRVRTYDLPVSAKAKAYCDAIWAWPSVQKWVAGAKDETLRARRYET
ncbi:MAG: glutathione S-transferase family protein [Deltaproteobacteria bacterium]|nr:glutathione S-transferase family protein [Deltaproteobacteria bacterium]